MSMWLEAVVGWFLILFGEASGFVTQHWIGIVIFLAFWALWDIRRLLRETTSRLAEVVTLLNSIESHTDAMSTDDVARQNERAEMQIFESPEV